MEYQIDSHSLRTWSTRLLKKPMSMGVAVEAIYLFDDEGRHRGTVSFFPEGLADLLDPAHLQQPMAAVSVGRVELRYFMPQFAQILDMVKTGKAEIYYNDPTDAGIHLS